MESTRWEAQPDGTVEGGWWHPDPASGRIVCDLCPRECRLKPGDRGFCFVRENRDNKMVLATYGRSTGFCIDPIEKKPLNHFYPGTSVLSFGTAGCNLGCQFCQNWDISKSREVAKLSQFASPETIARGAQQLECKSVAFTYNDPIVWAEYAIDTARACRELGIQTVAVTAGYIAADARGPFFRAMDAANVDLKAFTEEFYHKITYSHLQPVLDTLLYLKQETEVWFEITNLVIPDLNDSPTELKQMCDWILDALGPDVPIHFSAFHPDFRMRDRPNTPIETLFQAYDIATATGLRYVYVGNVHHRERHSTYCPNCKEVLIERDWYQLGQYRLDGNRCSKCDFVIAGRFGETAGDWGPRRQPVRIQDYASPTLSANPNSLLQLQSSAKKPTRISTMETATPNLLAIDGLNEEELQSIHRTVSRFVAAAVQGRTATRSFADAIAPLANAKVMGLFVTLKRGKQLRGCCGLVGQPISLLDAISNASYRTAKEDSRMPAISPTELPYLHLDVTLLAAPEPLKGSGEPLFEQFEIGKHGLRLFLGNHAGLLLPSVPVEQGWDKRQFLQGLCRKAGLAEDAWKQEGVRVERFEGKPIEGQIDPEDYGAGELKARSIVSPAQVQLLCAMASQSVLALSKGATPNYVNPNLPDGNVHGMVLSIFNTEIQKPLAHLVRVSMRPGIPLQSTLFELSQAAASILTQSKPQRDIQLEIGLTVLHDPAQHGYLMDKEHRVESAPTCHLEGIDTKHRALVTMVGNARIAIAFDSEKPADVLVEDSIEALSAHGRTVNIFSMEAVSTYRNLVASTTPLPQAGPGIRPPAVAGRFYPAADEERKTMVSSFLEAGESDSSNQQKRKAYAIMTPHAGLQFSGRIAGNVWKQVEIPPSVLILGPKHTNHGVDWAVAPYRRWKLSDQVGFDADQELAQAIAEGVSGIQLDASAHVQEHGIEVQLPFLEQIAPQTKIAAIAMAAGTLHELQHAAKQLAVVLRRFDPMPLLVISSDMNHYASETENRRLDRMALDAMKTGDAKKLLETCQDHRISMCGVLPAALVMLTLHELHLHFECQELSYTTSAEANGDTSRVVGYAGMILAASGK